MSSEKKLPIIDLDALIEPVARVKLSCKEHDVLPISGTAFDMATKVHEAGDSLSPTDKLDYMRKIMKALVPTVDDDAIIALSPKQIARILSIASGKVEQVQTRIKAEDAKNGKRSARRARSGR